LQRKSLNLKIVFKRWLQWSAALLVAVTVAAAEAAFSACTGTRQNYSYPVVLKGPPELRGVLVKLLSGTVLRDGKWVDIPIQVEEVNAEGDYVLEGGLPYTRDTDDGLFDSEDEVALMGDDLGEDFALESVPQGIRERASANWKMTFCRGDRLIGHMLLQSRFSDPRPPARNYVTFDQAANAVSSDLYEYRFHQKNPVLLGEVALKKDGRRTSVIESSQFQMPLRTPFFMPNLTFRDSDFTSVIESWQSGPVRTIIAVGVKYTSFLSLFKLHLFSELVFYRNRFVIPTKIEFVFSPRSFLKPGSGVAYALKLPAEQGWQFESNLAALPMVGPDRYFDNGPRAATQDSFYAVAHGRDGSLLARVSVDEKARAMVPMPIMLRAEDFASKQKQEVWPWLVRQNADLGVFIDFSNVEKGMYNFGLDLLLSSKADERFTDYGLVEAVWHRLP
jgi:hypothetical protein